MEELWTNNNSNNNSKMDSKHREKMRLERRKRPSMVGRTKFAYVILWMFRIVMSAIALQIAIVGGFWGCRLHLHFSAYLSSSSTAATAAATTSAPALPLKRIYENKGYLLISSNGGLNQMRAGICDMVAIARYMNVSLIIPELDKTSFWNDSSEFKDIFNVDYFMTSLSDELQIMRQVPPHLEGKTYFSMPPVSWSNISYYLHTILPKIEEHEILHLTKTDARLANNGIPEEVQKLRCRVNYKALRFIPPLEDLGKKIVEILKRKGPFVVLHLRYEMDMLAFSGCTEGCTVQEAKALTDMRYNVPWWKEKEINSTKQRLSGSCPLTPEETALTMLALGIDRKLQIYIAAGDIYGGERRLSSLRAAYPDLVKKEELLSPSDLLPFRNHSSQMAALDYIVSVQSDIFLATYGGNMAKVVEGHRRFLGFKKTIIPDRKQLVLLINEYKKGSLNWTQFAAAVKEAHMDRMGGPTKRVVIPGKPKEEDYFWSNPQECLPPP